VLALVGIERRVAASAQAADELRRQSQALLVQALGPTTLPPAAALTQELRRLDQAARSTTAAPLDCAGILQRLWTAWPAELRAQVELLSLTSDRLVLRGSLPSLADAERLAKACPLISVGDTVFQLAPLQAEQTPRGAVFLLTWQAANRPGRAP